MKKYISRNDLIYVAGHKGMAGSSIIRSFKSKGYNNIIYTDREELDLRDSEKVKSWFLFNNPKVVIIAAAKVGGIIANQNMPSQFIFDNLKIQINLIENAWKSGVKRLVFLGSSCIYPKLSKQPIKEEYLLSGKLEETNEPYAIAKIAGIKMCQALKKQYGFDAISIMPTNLYGPGDNYQKENSHVIPSLIRKFHSAKINNFESVTCWGTGEPLREFLHVDDLGSATLYLLENWLPNNLETQFINVGTGKDIRIKDLAEKISEIFNFKGKIIWDSSKPDGTYKKQLDISKINNLGWNSEISFDKGLRDTIDNYIKEFEAKNLRL